MTQVSFIGTGNMGELMAANIARAGFSVQVFDSDTERAKRLAARIGAACTTSLAEVAACDICVTMLPTSKIVQDVLLRGEDGAFLRHVKRGTVVVDMGSSEPGETQETGRLLAQHGVTLIDAPVSGGIARAENATLAIMIGSDDPAATERATPVLNAMGKHLYHVGKLGAGDAMKAANNYVAAATYAAAAEALSIGKVFGLDPKLMVDIFNVSTGRSFNSEVVFKDHVVTGRFATGFALGLLTKDVGIAARLGESLGVDAPVSRLVLERYRLAERKLGFSRDNSEAIRGWFEAMWEGGES